MQETWVWSLGWEDPWRRECLPTPIFLPGESHGQRSLARYSPWGRKKWGITEQLTLTDGENKSSENRTWGSYSFTGWWFYLLNSIPVLKSMGIICNILNLWEREREDFWTNVNVSMTRKPWLWKIDHEMVPNFLSWKLVWSWSSKGFKNFIFQVQKNIWTDRHFQAILMMVSEMKDHSQPIFFP